MLGRWCRQLKTEGSKTFVGKGYVRDDEMARLKRELARVKKERDFLKEAAAYFAKESSRGLAMVSFLAPQGSRGLHLARVLVKQKQSLGGLSALCAWILLFCQNIGQSEKQPVQVMQGQPRATLESRSIWRLRMVKH